jgi:hypothetical protein
MDDANKLHICSLLALRPVMKSPTGSEYRGNGSNSYLDLQLWACGSNGLNYWNGYLILFGARVLLFARLLNSGQQSRVTRIYFRHRRTPNIVSGCP